MQARRLNEDDLARAVKALCRKEPRFIPVVKQHGLPSLRASPAGLETLLTMVTEQFLSLSAAAAIWKRLKLRLEDCHPAKVLACPQEELLTLGLSRAKARSFHGLAQAVASNEMDFQVLETLDDAAAHKSLVALPGIGPWTADIYLLSVMLRPDVWPWGDVALQAAAQNLFEFAERPDKKQMIALGDDLRPHRATAARLLWAHYRGMKKMSQA